MTKLEKFFFYLIASISIFSTLSLLISSSIWLDMRVHASYVVYASFLIGLILFFKQALMKLKSLAVFDILFLAVVLFGKFSRVSYELRDAFKLPIEINIFKVLLIFVLLGGNAIIFYRQLRARS
ncbi:MAG: hypothetical protein SPI59_04380 [Finegoldia sp.]|nr:hypothetical protein [Finegoldia sp.]